MNLFHSRGTFTSLDTLGTVFDNKVPFNIKVAVNAIYIADYSRFLLTVKQHAFAKHVGVRDVPDPDSTIRYPVKCRHPALSGIRVEFAGYLPDSTVTYFITNIKWKT